jgi:hypothetical protein
MTDLKSKDIRSFAKDLIKQERENPSKIYTSKEINSSKHPDKPCQLCGQLGCDRKYAGQYVHNKCFRILQKNTFNLMDSKKIMRK